MGNNGFYNYLRANFVPDITFERACELKAQFFTGYADLARWQDGYARHTREQGYTQTVVGRRWRWKWQAQDPENVDEDAPFYDDAISGFRGAYAVNHPVQGSSAEVMQIALTRLDQALHDEPAGSSQPFTTKRCCWFQMTLLLWNASVPSPSRKWLLPSLRYSPMRRP
jgi:DNA polymerase I-like protein with 3'-5' exonuclease and polymerase domains